MQSPFALITALSVLLAVSVPLGATPKLVEPVEPSAAPGLLETLRRQLEALRTGLMRTGRSKADAEQVLIEAEKSLAEADREISSSEKARRQANHALGELESHGQALERRIRRQREEQARWLRAMFYLGPGDYLKMVLNQEDPRRASRLAGDYQYLMQQRAAEVAVWQASLAELAENGRRIQARRVELAELGARQAETRQRLFTLKQDRVRALDALKAQASGEEERISELTRSEQRLAAVIAELHASAPKQAPEPKVPERSTAPAPPRDALLPDEMQAVMPESKPLPKPAAESPGGFAALKGSLVLPLERMPVIRFGQPRPPGSQRVQGLVFHTEEGAPVRAIAPGRIAYADWLKGFGLLLIVDHGDGYMSLYGHNRSTDKRVGEGVEAGEVIAAVGESGGLERPTLYFEIRHQGRPDDPLLWCRAP